MFIFYLNQLFIFRDWNSSAGFATLKGYTKISSSFQLQNPTQVFYLKCDSLFCLTKSGKSFKCVFAKKYLTGWKTSLHKYLDILKKP